MTTAATETKARPLVHRGSVKNIERVNETTLAFVHTDRFSVFDCGPHPQEIPGIGEALCACNVASFALAAAIGVPTHFIKQEDSRTIWVREFRTVKDRKLGRDETDCMIPLEWIDRAILAGSLLRDFHDGSKKPMEYGFASNDRSALPVEGTPLPFPVHQFTTKWEKVDRSLTKDEALLLGGLSPEEWDRAWAVIDRLNGALSLAAKSAGFTRLDGKKELALSGPQRQIVVIDAFGNPHEDRYAYTAAREGGEVAHYSKEYLRQLFIKNGFYAKVKAARKAGDPDPLYPLLTQGEIDEAKRRFQELAKWYTLEVEELLATG